MKFNEYMVLQEGEGVETLAPAKLQYDIKVPPKKDTNVGEDTVDNDKDQKSIVIKFNGVTANKVIKQLGLIVNNKAPRTFIIMASSPDEMVIFDNKTDWKSFLDLNMSKEQTEEKPEKKEKQEPKKVEQPPIKQENPV